MTGSNRRTNDGVRRRHSSAKVITWWLLPIREPRPKGAQKGVVKRDHQKGQLNFSEGARRTRGGRVVVT